MTQSEGRTETGTNNLKFCAREMLMFGLQSAISNCPETEEMQPAMIKEFRRVEKFLGFTPDSWSPFV